MRSYQDVVVGAGAAGLTAAVLLATAGRRVLLVEKGPRIGGSLPRFRLGGVPFDTGFHFTGGFNDGGLADGMLRVLGIRDAITPIPLPDDRSNRFVFENEGREFEFPCGPERLAGRLKQDFPRETGAIDRYFDAVNGVCARTAGMTLETLRQAAEPLDEDFVSLRDVLDSLTGDPFLKALLSGYCMCYGVKPSEISFANHARMCQGLYESVVRVDRGGDAFVDAFEARLAELGVDVACRRHIVRCEDVVGRRARRLVLDDGEEIAFESCIFAIHPADIVKVLPRELVSPAFAHRVERMEPSSGFFTAYGVLDGEEPTSDRTFSIVSLFPSTDVDSFLDEGRSGDSAAVILTSPLERHCDGVRPVCTLEPSTAHEVAKWRNTRTGDRPADYEAYKEARARRFEERLRRSLPEVAARYRRIATASQLTYRDYLNSPDGSAYGVKQRLGQINVFGRLPALNMYAAGQSSLLPGVVGAMMSSFMVTRAVLGGDELADLIATRSAR